MTILILFLAMAFIRHWLLHHLTLQMQQSRKWTLHRTTS